MRLPPPTARTRSGTGSGSDIDETQSPVGLVVKPATLKDTEGAVSTEFLAQHAALANGVVLRRSSTDDSPKGIRRLSPEAAAAAARRRTSTALQEIVLGDRARQ